MKKRYFIVIIFSILSFQLTLSQEVNDTLKTQNIDEIKINSNKIYINKSQNASQIEVFTQKKIEFQNFQNTADLLSNSGSLFVQKSQQGGGSPVIRGFESSRVLLLVDGIRMNNLIFRSGHLQNILTVDENFLETVIVYYGPTSTLYGSDALGGSVNMITKKPKYNSDLSGNVNTRYSSVNEEKSGYFDINYGTKNWASFTAFSYNDFGDMKMGRTKNHNGDFFGERPFYAENVNGIDVVTLNYDKYLQRKSGYKQYNFMQKLSFKTKQNYIHNLNFQYSTSTDIPRYDRLTETSTTTGLKFGDWYYGPQKRVLTVYSIEKENIFKNTDFKTDFSYQNAQESRNDRRFGKYDLQKRKENVNVFSLASNFETKFKKGNFYYGVENYYENLKSTAFKQNINTGEIGLLDTRYPDGKNNMSRSDLYASYSSKRYKNTNWTIGGRVGYVQLNSQVKNNLLNLPFTEIKQNNITYSGTLGIVHNASENFIVKSNLSSGFRVPNIDDLAKIFDSTGDRIIVPNENLNPEKTVTADLGFVLKSDSNKHQFDATYYYTKLYDAIVTDNFLFNGQSTIMYDGNLSEVFANQNKGKAFVTGLSVAFKTSIASKLQFNANYNLTLGRVIENSTKKPLDHVPPTYGKIGLNYNPNWAIFEAYMLFNGKKDLTEYSDSGEDNLVYAPANGMPAWETYNFKAGTKPMYGFTLFAGMENILDTQYRNFASGINAGGRNIYGGAKYSF